MCAHRDGPEHTNTHRARIARGGVASSTMPVGHDAAPEPGRAHPHESGRRQCVRRHCSSLPRVVDVGMHGLGLATDGVHRIAHYHRPSSLTRLRPDAVAPLRPRPMSICPVLLAGLHVASLIRWHGAHTVPPGVGLPVQSRVCRRDLRLTSTCTRTRTSICVCSARHVSCLDRKTCPGQTSERSESHCRTHREGTHSSRASPVCVCVCVYIYIYIYIDR